MVREPPTICRWHSRMPRPWVYDKSKLVRIVRSSVGVWFVWSVCFRVLPHPLRGSSLPEGALTWRTWIGSRIFRAARLFTGGYRILPYRGLTFVPHISRKGNASCCLRQRFMYRGTHHVLLPRTLHFLSLPYSGFGFSFAVGVGHELNVRERAYPPFVCRGDS